MKILKALAIFISLVNASLVSAQAPVLSELDTFKTCIDELQAEITYGKKVMIKDFKLKIRQKDILVYGPYNVSDQYFKIDYVLYTPKPSKITVEFDLSTDDDGSCAGVQFHDYVY